MTHFLNSECVFEVIGNYPVVDQFDVLYTNLQSGSYTDDYVTGSMLIATANPSGVGFTYTQGNRGRAFSKLGVERNSKPEQEYENTKRSYNLQPWRSRAGTVKTLKLFSHNERFYDSLTPDLSKLVKAYGTEIEYFGPNNPRIILNLGYNPFSADPAVIPKDTAKGFLETFAFEPKYSGISRLKKIESGFLPTIQGSGVTQRMSPVKNFYIQSAGDYLKTDVGLVTNFPYIVGYNFGDPPTTANPGPGASPSDISKVIFGFGDWNSRVDNLTTLSYQHWPTFRSGSTSVQSVAGGNVSSVCSPQIRGWKYGLIDGMPHYTSAVFRRDRFGQFRDMLEQRVFPVTYLDSENAPNNYFGFEGKPLPIKNEVKIFKSGISPLGANAKEKVTIEYPITVNFVQQTVQSQGPQDDQIELLTYVEQRDRNYTWSSNLDSHATSSLPFFDLENDSLGRNRGLIPEDIDSAIFV